MSHASDESERVQHILELVRTALRDDLIPGSVAAPVLSHCIEVLLDIRGDLYGALSPDQ